MPGSLRFPEIAERTCKLDAHLLQPFDGLGALAEVGGNQVAVHIEVGIVHVQVQCLGDRNIVELILLDLGADSEGAHAHVGGAAGGARFFEDHGLEAALSRGDGRGQTGRTAGNDDDIGVDLFHGFSPFMTWWIQRSVLTGLA